MGSERCRQLFSCGGHYSSVYYFNKVGLEKVTCAHGISPGPIFTVAAKSLVFFSEVPRRGPFGLSQKARRALRQQFSRLIKLIIIPPAEWGGIVSRVGGFYFAAVIYHFEIVVTLSWERTLVTTWCSFDDLFGGHFRMYPISGTIFSTQPREISTPRFTLFKY